MDRGGHNPIEPLRSGYVLLAGWRLLRIALVLTVSLSSCTVFTGPYMRNFADIVDRLQTAAALQPEAKALIPVDSAAALTRLLPQHLTPNDRQVFDRRPAVANMMRTLATETTHAYERRLRQWLAEP